MATKIFKLHFRGPVHFGNGRLSDSGYTFNAATFFSALYIEALHMGLHNELLRAVQEGNLKVSDAFPFIGETLYVPKPFMGPREFDRVKTLAPVSSKVRKASKKLDYIPVEKLKAYCAGEFDYIEELARFNLGKSGLVTKVNLTREYKNDADPYFVGGYTFDEQGGLYIISAGEYDIAPIIESLSYSGLGGKRTGGYGRFEYEETSARDVMSSANAGSSKAMLLSSALPAKVELSQDLLRDARYAVVRHGGFVQSATYSSHPLKKKDVYLFKGGSVFNRRFEGEILDVSTVGGAHPVYCYAKAMWMEV
jgi:CRISPR-associated protein Csm4